MKQRQKISDNAAQFIKSIERRQSISREELFSLIENNNEINEETRLELSTIINNIPIRNNNGSYHKPVKHLNNLRKESLKKRGALKSKRISDAAVHYIEKSESCQSLSKDDFLKKMRDDFKITDETCKYVEENVREEMSEIENQTGRTAKRTRRVSMYLVVLSIWYIFKGLFVNDQNILFTNLGISNQSFLETLT